MPKKKVIVEGRSRQERIKVRKELGSLKNMTVQPSTRKRYDNALNEFFAWLKTETLELPRKKEQMDSLVAEYLEWLWSSGDGRAKANDTVAALQDFDPKLKGRYQLSWRLLRTWSTSEIPNRAPPLPQEALHAMVGFALCNNAPHFGLSLLVAFYGLLRTGEILNVTAADVTVPSPNKPAVIALGLTKGGKRTGVSESVTITALEVVKRLYDWKISNKQSTRLTQSPHQWRKQFADTVEALGWTDFLFRPYSLRRGGSTFWFGRHGNFDKLMQLGRWQALRSARLYLNDGLAMQASLRLPRNKAKPYLKAYSHSLTRHWHTAWAR